MYTSYFGLNEKPFRLVPDPSFLFLSASHEEALAHLSYAVSQQEGFARVTGEVGTGKTTLCRSFLEDLGPDVETAFIFNSKLDAKQLLKAILAELSIACESRDTSEMTQALYLFLLEKKTAGKTVVLLIDEAQNLGRETLEQLRLLSNLETTKNKLLQIILVGQPELSELLNTHDMRQLRQRINLSCRIRPLNLEDTRRYIRHRINKACGRARSLFTPRAVNLIFRYTKGTPRLINILCDRSLVAAFSLGKKQVTPALVKTAFKEVDAGRHRTVEPEPGPGPGFHSAVAVVALACAGCLAALLIFVFFIPDGQNRLFDLLGTPSASSILDSQPQKPLTSSAPEPAPGSTTIQDVLPETFPDSVSIPETGPVPPVQQEPYPAPAGTKAVPVQDPDKIPKPVPVLSGDQDISSWLAQIAPRATRENVLALVLSLWADEKTFLAYDSGGSDKTLSDPRFFEVRAMQASQLKVLHLLGDKNQIKLFNLPAILSFSVDGQTGFLAVTGMENQNLCCVAADDIEHSAKVDIESLAPFLSQDIFILWKDIFGHSRVILPSSPPAAVISVKLALLRMGFENIEPTAAYDAALVNAVKTVQKKYGLVPDGLVGPMTKIVLFQELEAGRSASKKTDSRLTSPTGTMVHK